MLQLLRHMAEELSVLPRPPLLCVSDERLAVLRRWTGLRMRSLWQDVQERASHARAQERCAFKEEMAVRLWSRVDA